MTRSMLTVSLAVGLLMSVARADTVRSIRGEEDSRRPRGSVHGAGSNRASRVSRCPADAVLAGAICLDTYEASVWRVPDPTDTNALLVAKIRQGTASEADLAAGGATQLGVAGDDYAPCLNSGQNCADDIYAVSLRGVLPSEDITWFQAQEACANAGKRLPNNAEWQMGADGSRVPGPARGGPTCTAGNGAA